MKSLTTIGFDAGGTYLKYGTPINPFMLPLPYNEDLIFKLLNPDISKILLTGAGAKTIFKWLEQNSSFFNSPPILQIYNEFMATGLGGAKIGNRPECIVVNIGSGTPVLYVNALSHSVDHISGTGLGSASLVGLSHFILNINDLNQIAESALKGDSNKVNLLVGDLYDRASEDLGLPGDITASNFGKYQDWRVVTNKPTTNDILAGLHVLIAESIAVIANQASRPYKSNLPIVITGGGTMNNALVKALKKTFAYLHKEVIIPEQAIFGTLQGLFVLDAQSINT